MINHYIYATKKYEFEIDKLVNFLHDNFPKEVKDNDYVKSPIDVAIEILKNYLNKGSNS